ncbi:MAG: 50S ribosomal protein L11 [Bacilli bacterium]|nr:50S ribosomal protein L11 [Bacilli bacterium]
MPKRVTRVMIIRAPGAGANPAKLGQKLGPFGIGGKFCQAFNLKTADRKDEIVPCVLTIYEDRTFDMSFKTTPTTYLILKAAKLEKGRKGTDKAGDPKKTIGKITKADVQKIAEYKKPDLNVDSIEAAERCVEGSCKSMGIEVVD